MLIMKAVNGVSVAFVYERWSCHFTFSPKFAVSSVFAWVPVEVGDRLSREKVRKKLKFSCQNALLENCYAYRVHLLNFRSSCGIFSLFGS